MKFCLDCQRFIRSRKYAGRHRERGHDVRILRETLQTSMEQMMETIAGLGWVR